ncbi:MAG TPA: nuclear transport factor 2 family protein [Patescibacteria group bacterium]|nr:nuclear transport factor 2 family protein [Patescibacteria group bacterium]
MQNHWTKDIFAAIDAMDTDKFASFIAEDGQLTFGNNPTVHGRENIHAVIDGFFKAIAGISHDVQNVFDVDGHVIMRGTSSYTRHDGSQLTTPFCNVFKMEGNKIKTYDIYIDLSQLFQPVEA